jgi:hypothetical protein
MKVNSAKISRNLRSAGIFLTITVGFVFFLYSMAGVYVRATLETMIQELEIGSYRIQFSGFHLSFPGHLVFEDIRIHTDSSKEPLAYIDELAVDVSGPEILKRVLFIEAVKIHRIQLTVSSMDDFFRNLARISSGDVFHTEKGYFEDIFLGELYFEELVLDKPFDFFFASDDTKDNFIMKSGLRFQGRAGLKNGMLTVDSQAVSHKGSELIMLPLAISMSTDIHSLDGVMHLSATTCPLEEFLQLEHLEYEGFLTLQSDLRFSTKKGDEMQNWQSLALPGDRVLRYTLKGGGALSLSHVKYNKIELHDISADAHWTHEHFRLASVKGGLFSGSLSGDYDYSSIRASERHQYSFHFKQVSLNDILTAFDGGSGEYATGLLSGGISGSENGTRVDALELKEATLFGNPWIPEPFQVETEGGVALAGLSLKSQGGIIASQYPHGPLILKWNQKGDLEAQCEIQKLPLSDFKTLQAFDTKGKLSLFLKFLITTRGISDFSADGVLENGRFYGLNFKETRLSGTLQDGSPEISLQGLLGEDEISVDMDILKGSPRFRLRAPHFPAESLSVLFPNSSFYGTASVTAEYIHSEIPSFVLESESNEVYFNHTLLKSPVFRAYLNEGRYQLKYVDEGTRLLAQGDIELSKISNGIFTALGDSHFEFNLSNIEILDLFPGMQWVNIDSGKVHGTGEKIGKKFNIKLSDAELVALRHHCALKKPAELTWVPDSLPVSVEPAVFNLSDNNGLGLGEITVLSTSKELKVQLIDVSSETLGAFSSVVSEAPLYAKLNAAVILSLKGNSVLDGGLSYRVKGAASPVYVDTGQEQVYLQSINAELSVENNYTEIHSVRLNQDGSDFMVSGRIPCGMDSKMIAACDKNGELSLNVHLPPTPLSVLHSLVLLEVDKMRGNFGMKVAVKGTWEHPQMDGDLFVNLHELNWSGASGGPGLQVKNFNLFGKCKDSEINFSEIRGQINAMDVEMAGKVAWYPSIKWELSGGMRSSHYEGPFFTISKAALHDLHLGGDLERINGVGVLKGEQGNVNYETLIQWLDSDSSILDRFPLDYDFVLRFGEFKEIVLENNMFRFQMKPHGMIRLQPEGSLMDGEFNIYSGALHVAGNRFRIQPTSQIRFVPLQFKSGSSLTPFSLNAGKDSASVWDKQEFQDGTLVEKLDYLWKEKKITRSSGLHIGEKRFDTLIALDAVSGSGEDEIRLNLRGSFDSMDYKLSSRDGTLSSEDLLRRLINRGSVSSRKRQSDGDKTTVDTDESTLEKVDSSYDTKLLSSQLSSHLQSQLLGRHFEQWIRNAFQLDEFRVEPNVLGQDMGSRISVGTRLSDDIFVLHEQETGFDTYEARTRLRLDLDERLNLFFERERKEHSLGDGIIDEEDSRTFGFERNFRF